MENLEVHKKDLTKKDEVFGSFFIGDMEVAINVRAIHEVVNLPEKVIKMPLAPTYLLGVFNLRGLIIPIINLKALLKFEEFAITSNQKIAIIDHEGAKVGLVFDSTSEIIRVTHEILNEFNYSSGSENNIISGAIKLDSGNRILQIINPFALLSIENIPQIIDQQAKNIKNGRFSINQSGSRNKCISFSMNDIVMGFEISGIHEIIKVPEIHQSPIRNEFCIGMVNLRGLIVPVVDLSLMLGGSRSQDLKGEDKRIIILKVAKELFGLLVESVESINSYRIEDVMAIPLLSKTRSQMFLGCISIDGFRDIILLNYQEVLSNNEIREITQGHSKFYNNNLEIESQASNKKLNRQAYISFKLDHLFGVSIKDIREIINYSDEIISAPGMPPFVRGVLNLRGKLLTVIDTRLLYSMEHKNLVDDKTKILIFDSGEERFGLIVDSVESIITVDEDKKMKVPSLMVQKVQDKFANDIKEIITFKQFEEKEGVLVILNMEPVTTRIRHSIAA